MCRSWQAAAAGGSVGTRCVLQRTLETVPSGQAVGWSVPETGRKGTVTPLRTFHAQVGFCREYRVTEVGPDGPGPTANGTACRDASGIWQPAAGFRSGP